MSLSGDWFHITFPYLLEIISPIVGWCSIGTFTNPCLCWQCQFRFPLEMWPFCLWCQLRCRAEFPAAKHVAFSSPLLWRFWTGESPYFFSHLQPTSRWDKTWDTWGSWGKRIHISLCQILKDFGIFQTLRLLWFQKLGDEKQMMGIDGESS